MSKRKWMALVREMLIRADVDPMRVDDILADQFDLRVSEKLKVWAFVHGGEVEAREEMQGR